MPLGSCLGSTVVRSVLLLPLTALGCSWLVPSEPRHAVPDGVPLPRFEEVPVEFAHVWDRAKAHHLTGASVLDVDVDGRYEIFVGGGEGQPDALLALREGRLVDRIAGTGLSSQSATYGSTAIDFDRDGDVDLLVCGNDGVTFYRNPGAAGGAFRAEPLGLRLPENSVPLAVAVSDIDRDGDGDLYVSAFVDYPHFVPATFNVPEHAKQNLMLRNDGDLRFTDVTTPATASKQNTFNSVFVDLDGDRLQDLVVAQNTGQVEILRNRGDGAFDPVPLATGYGFWMGIATGDADNDGDQDLYFPNVGDSFPGFLAQGDLHDDQPYAGGWLLLRNDGGFHFTDRTREAGLAGLGFAWGAVFEDLNLDGRLDLIVSQNYVKWPVHRVFKFPGKVLLGGPEADLHFAAARVAENPSFSNSPVVADLDGDARQDLFWLNNDGPSRAYLNRSEGDAVVVRMPDDVRALGARVHVEGAGPGYTREVSTSVGMGTDQTPELVFGLGNGGRAERVVIAWADGKTTSIEDPPLNRPVLVK
jgi:hypothetical protein